MAESLRCFVALDLGAAAEMAVRGAIERLKRHGAAVRWVRPEQLHLTLKFLGPVAPERVPEIRAALREIDVPGPLRLQCSGLGSFPPRGRPRVLWVGLAGDVESVVELARQIETRLAALGFPRERRPFRPHLTIGRVKGPRGLDDVIAEFDRVDLGGDADEVTTFSLYQSILRPEGAKYDELERFSFRADPDA